MGYQKCKPGKAARVVWIALAIFFGFFAFGMLFQQLTVTRYTVTTGKVRAPVRMVLLTDLHSCNYGEGQQKLIRAVEAARPDAILMAGDIFDDKLPHQKALEFLDGLGGRWPVYYVTGNHEFWSGEARELKQAMRDRGVRVLDGTRETAVLNGQQVEICGVDDPEAGEAEFDAQIKSALGAPGKDYRIFLSHRPERFPAYCEYEFDLALCGHAHGGFLRIPGVPAGLIAPGQGFFPKYNAGVYQRDGKTMILSRGLARESSVPRVYNPPEVVVVEIEPEPTK